MQVSNRLAVESPTRSTLAAGVDVEGGLVGRDYYVYILANKHDTVLYTGATNDLKRRVC